MTCTAKRLEAVADHRRQQVAALKLRGLSEQEIVAFLDDELKLRNPANDQPWHASTVHRDIVSLQEEWRQNAKAQTSDHFARVLAELQEVKRLCWRQKNAKGLLQALSQEAKLLGLNAPTKVAPVMPDGVTPWLAAASQMSDEELFAVSRMRRLVEVGVPSQN